MVTLASQGAVGDSTSEVRHRPSVFSLPLSHVPFPSHVLLFTRSMVFVLTFFGPICCRPSVWLQFMFSTFCNNKPYTTPKTPNAVLKVSRIKPSTFECAKVKLLSFS